jgi:uncharacterized membrane protein YfcA
VVRRSTAIAAMLVGAIVGAVLYLHTGTTWPLAIIAVAVLTAAAVFALSPDSHLLDATGNAPGT